MSPPNALPTRAHPEGPAYYNPGSAGGFPVPPLRSAAVDSLAISPPPPNPSAAGESDSFSFSSAPRQYSPTAPESHSPKAPWNTQTAPWPRSGIISQSGTVPRRCSTQPNGPAQHTAPLPQPRWSHRGGQLGTGQGQKALMMQSRCPAMHGRSGSSQSNESCCCGAMGPRL